MKKKIMILIIFLVMISANAQKTNNAQLSMDEKVGGNILEGKQKFASDWAILQVDPANAWSPPKAMNFSQTLQVCNNATDYGYLFLDYWFYQPLRYSSLYRQTNWVETIPQYVSTPICTNVGKVPNNYTTCDYSKGYWLDQNYSRQNITALDSLMEKKEWDGHFHYFTREGEYFAPKECREYKLNYKPNIQESNGGKWNLQVWGNINNDWSCIESKSCAYSYTLDPTFSTNFTYKKQINISLPISGVGINNYTAEIDLTLANHNFNHTQPDGDDVVFVDTTETSVMGCYKESFDNTTLGNYSVLIPNFTNSSMTTLWIYYGNTTMSNQFCAQPNNAYLLADLANVTHTTAVNTTIWNQNVGAYWGVASDNDYQLNTTVAAQQCLIRTNISTQACYAIANTSGILKQSQSIEINSLSRMPAGFNSCGIGASIGDFSSQDGIIGNNNASWALEDEAYTAYLYQNATQLATNNKNRTAIYMNYQWRLDSWNGTYSFRNTSVNKNNEMLPRLIANKGFVTNLNKSSALAFQLVDASNVGLCVNVRLTDVRVKAFLNTSPNVGVGSEQAVTVNAPIAAFVTNQTWETSGLLDSGGVSNYTIFIEYDGNTYNNISQINFSINGVTYRDSQIQNVSNGTSNNQTKFNISVYTPLVSVNNTAIQFNWSFTQMGNSSSLTAYSNNLSQNVLWGWYVNNFTYVSPLVGGHANNVFINFTKSNLNPIGMYYNVTLEWNQSNKTGSVISTNSTPSEVWNTTFSTVPVTTQTNVQMKGWLNISFNGSYVIRDPNATQVLIPVSVNSTSYWYSPINETNLTMFSVNLTWNGNDVNNISGVNFTYDFLNSNNTFSGAVIQNVSGYSSGNINWTYFNITLRPNLTSINNSNYSFQWNFTVNTNISNSTTSTSVQNQTIYWAYWANNVTWTTPVFEGVTNTFIVNMTKLVDDAQPSFSRNLTIEYDSANRSIGVLDQNNSAWETWNISFSSPLSGTYFWKSWLNLSFQNIFRSRSNYSSTQITNGTQVVLSDGSETNETWANITWETSLTNFTLNVSNHSTITQINFTYAGLVYNPTNITSFSNYSSGNYTDFNLTIRPNLIDINRTNQSFKWNWTLSLGQNKSSTGYSQEVLLNFYINNVTWTSPIPENTINTFLINNSVHTCPVLNSWNISESIEYNGSNTSYVSPGSSVACASFYSPVMPNVYSPNVSADIYVSFKPWMNISFNGLTKNRTFTNQSQYVLNDGTINNETYNTPVLETSLGNWSINITNMTSITNINFTWNSTTSIGSLISNSSSGNYTVFNITLQLPLVPSNRTNYSFQWNYSLSSIVNLSSNLTNQTILWAYYPNKLDLQSPIYELFPQTAGVNITKHLFAQGVNWTVNIEYNGSNLSTTQTINGSNHEDWNVTFITASVSSDVQVQGKGWLNLSYGGNNYLRNTSNATQTILNLNFSCGKCYNTTSNFTAVLNFSFYDEFGNQSIAQNGSDSITLWTTLQTVNQTFGCNFNNVTFHELCIQNIASNFTANYNVQYGSNTSPATYNVREFWKRNQSISNQTLNNTLYNLLSVNSTEIIITVQNPALNKLQNVIIEAWKFNVSNNSFMMVDSGISDFDGNTRLRLFKADDYYQFIARDGGGQNILTTTMFKLLFTQYFLTISPAGQVNILTVIQTRFIDRNISFHNSTKTFFLQYLDTLNVSDNYCLEIVNTSNYNQSIMSKQCSSNRSGSFSYVIGNMNGTYIGKFVTGSNSVMVDFVEAVLDTIILLGKDAFFAAFILVGVVSAAGWVVSPPISLVLMSVGLVTMYWMQILPIHWAGLVSIVAVLLLGAFAIRRGI